MIRNKYATDKISQRRNKEEEKLPLWKRVQRFGYHVLVMIQSEERCIVCKSPLHRNNVNQIQKYHGECRNLRTRKGRGINGRKIEEVQSVSGSVGSL